MQMLHFSSRRMKQARLRQGWSQSDLAREAGTTERNIGRWERGENVPRAEMVATIARATGHEIEFFYVEGDGDEEDEEAALRRQARELLAPLNDSMVDALLVECKAHVTARQVPA